MGRRKAPERSTFKAWQPADYYRCKYLPPPSECCPTHQKVRSFANFSLKPSRTRSLSFIYPSYVRPYSLNSLRFGWFWECPNGDGCQYRHALPPGFVLKSQKKAADEAAKANTISLEDFLEVEVKSYILYTIGRSLIRLSDTN
jgi:hypothetical protein